MPGRSTFTATARGPFGVITSARCTCAIEAAATGGPKLLKTAVKRLVESRDDRRFRRACENGAMRSCRLSSSRASLAPTTSGRVARNCPSFT